MINERGNCVFLCTSTSTSTVHRTRRGTDQSQTRKACGVSSASCSSAPGRLVCNCPLNLVTYCHQYKSGQGSFTHVSWTWWWNWCSWWPRIHDDDDDDDWLFLGRGQLSTLCSTGTVVDPGYIPGSSTGKFYIIISITIITIYNQETTIREVINHHYHHAQGSIPHLQWPSLEDLWLL